MNEDDTKKFLEWLMTTMPEQPLPKPGEWALYGEETLGNLRGLPDDERDEWLGRRANNRQWH